MAAFFLLTAHVFPPHQVADNRPEFTVAFAAPVAEQVDSDGYLASRVRMKTDEVQSPRYGSGADLSWRRNRYMRP
jgi:hypothetical protein